MHSTMLAARKTVLVRRSMGRFRHRWWTRKCCSSRRLAPRKLNMQLPYDPAIPLVGIHPKELKAGTQEDNCTHRFTAASFTAAKDGSNPVSTEERLSRMRSIRTVARDSASTRKEGDPAPALGTDGPFLSHDTEHLLTNHIVNLLFDHLYPLQKIFCLFCSLIYPRLIENGAWHLAGPRGCL